MRRRITLILGLAPALGVWAQGRQDPLEASLGRLKLRPGGFLETVLMSRSATTGDNLRTNFGRIPLTPTPAETFVAFGHSRLTLHGELPAGPAKITGYAESDFLADPGHRPYRWRQYWGQVEVGKWQILGGQAWSLLRPNRRGIQTESGTMNTWVIDPSYHPGLIGRRKRQIRVVRTLGDSAIGATYDSARDFSLKFAHDFKRAHIELTGLAGADRRRALSLAHVRSLGRVDWVSQLFWSQRVGPEALGMLPPGVHAHTTIQGVEWAVTRGLTVYGYGGVGYAARSAGNRTVRQWTAGFMHRVQDRADSGSVLLGCQVSQLDRSTWTGVSGQMTYLMLSVRYFLPRLH